MLIITTICYYCVISSISKDAGLWKSQQTCLEVSDIGMLFTVLKERRDELIVKNGVRVHVHAWAQSCEFSPALVSPHIWL